MKNSNAKKDLVREIFEILMTKSELIPENWDKSFQYLIGLAVWDIFSNNNEVIWVDKTICDIGSWRGSGRWISEVINHNYSLDETFDYVDFYMGGDFILDNKFCLFPIYVEIFDFLRYIGCDWRIWHPDLKYPESEFETRTIAKAYKQVFGEFPKKGS